MTGQVESCGATTLALPLDGHGVLEVELPPLRAGGDVGAQRAAHHLRQRFIPHGGDPP